MAVLLRRVPVRVLASWLLALGVLGVGRDGAAQQVSAAELKAAFLINFARFADWPADARADDAELERIAVGDRGVAAALEQTIRVHPSPLSMRVAVVKIDAGVTHCHLLYASGIDGRQAAQLTEIVKGLPVFTVADSDGFAEHGGVAQLIEERGRMRFAINAAAAQRSRLALNARLLSLATLVKDVPDATR